MAFDIELGSCSRNMAVGTAIDVIVSESCEIELPTGCPRRCAECRSCRLCARRSPYIRHSGQYVQVVDACFEHACAAQADSGQPIIYADNALSLQVSSRKRPHDLATARSAIISGMCLA